MAIIKDIETPQGIPTTYHKIVKVEMEFERESITIQTGLYFSKEARDAGKRPVWNEYITVPLGMLQGDFRKSLYEIITNYYGSYLKDGAADADDTVPDAVVLNTSAYTDPIVSPPEEPETP